MKPVFVRSAPEDASKIAEFLCKVFHAGPGDTVARPDHMHWKYWAEREDWTGSRSFRMERDGMVVAHGAPWPVAVHPPEGSALHGAQVIDWAAEPSAPGSGLALMKHIAPEHVDLIFALGGSEATRKILPVFGFKPFNNVSFFAKPLRPFAQMVSHQQRNWKSPARLARNLRWSLRDASPGVGWFSRAVAADEIRKWPEPGSGVTVLGRDASRFRYFAKCDLIRSQLYVVEREGREAGYFYLVFVPGQARVADAWVVGAEGWREIYALAIVRALEDPGVNEITAIAGLEGAEKGLELCGFERRNTERLMIYDPRKVLDPAARLHFQMIDNDAFFRHSGRPEYET